APAGCGGCCRDGRTSVDGLRANERRRDAGARVLPVRRGREYFNGATSGCISARRDLRVDSLPALAHAATSAIQPGHRFESTREAQDSLRQRSRIAGPLLAAPASQSRLHGERRGRTPLVSAVPCAITNRERAITKSMLAAIGGSV